MGWLSDLLDRMRARSSPESPTLEGGPQAGAATDIELPAGTQGDGEPGVGGPPLFVAELAEYRWVAQTEAVNAANANPDPRMWHDGTVRFNFERQLAHGHQVLRDRLADEVAGRIRDGAKDLYWAARDIADIRDELRVTEHELVEKSRERARLHQWVKENEHELGRSARRQSKVARQLKLVIAAVLIITELILSGSMFERALGIDLPGLGFVLAGGVMLMLVVIPHYTAQGLKEGMTRYHKFTLDAFRSREGEEAPAPAAMRRNVHLEEVEDRGFRWIAVALLLVLLGVIIPLSFLRAEHAGEGGPPWVLLYMFIQLAISGYFFLREWNDLSNVTEALDMATKLEERLRDRRAGLMAELADAQANFMEIGQDVLLALQEAPRWDSQIIGSYFETVEMFRGIIANHNPDLAPFLWWGPRTSLETTAPTDDSPRELDYVHFERPELLEPGPRNRRWWIDQVTAVFRDGSEEDAPPVDTDWLFTSNPEELLEHFLSAYFDVGPYRFPTELDVPPDAYEEPVPGDVRTGPGPSPAGEEDEGGPFPPRAVG